MTGPILDYQAVSEIQRFLKASEADIFRLLSDLVKIQSGTRNTVGVNRVAEVVKKAFDGMDVRIETIRPETCGVHLKVTNPCPDGPAGRMLLVGHMDTVFPADTSFRDLASEGDKVRGPGVIDMKGGLVVGIYALKALDALGLLTGIPFCFIFNSDEEIGSPTSSALIREEAKKSCCALVFEAGGLDNAVVTGRKGKFSGCLSIRGKAGHAAFAGKQKRSAIEELAHKILAMEALNDPDAGVSANVGLISGGIGPNTVPEEASARLDFRFLNPEDGLRLEKTVTAMVNRPSVPGTTSSLEITSRRPAMPQTRQNIRLYDTVKAVADRLSIPLAAELRQGASDANLIADEGTPVIDGLGPCGADDHSDAEYMMTETLFQRTLLTACALPELYGRMAG